MVQLLQKLFNRSKDELCAEIAEDAYHEGYNKGFEEGQKWTSSLRRKNIKNTTRDKSEVGVRETTVFEVARSLGIRIDTHTMARIIEFSIIGGGSNAGRQQLVGDLPAYLTVLGYAWIYGMHHSKFRAFPRGNTAYSAIDFINGCPMPHVAETVKKYAGWDVFIPRTQEDLYEYIEVSPPTEEDPPSTRQHTYTSPFDPNAHTYHSMGMSTTLGFCRKYGAGAGAHSGMYHSAIDTARAKHTFGMPLYSIAEGTVVYAGEGSGTFGHVLGIQHDGFICRFAHNSECLVSSGDHVQQGRLVARIGDGYGQWRPHCHNDFIRGSNANLVPYGDTSLPTVEEIVKIYINPMEKYR